MSDIFIHFGGMQNAQQNFLAALNKYNSILEQLHSQVRNHLAEWDGDARAAYDAKSREWAVAAQRMATAVSGMSKAIGESHDIHRGAEGQNVGVWSG
ncbi:WXG100 family type VII secretion target [Actinomadura logoneensis]|uniref:WXG100 family type VII secretion target n=1 Tax=Actinomadura logoneensis TaxID=2293572 RepID=A0A372JVD4_9ACTN|nr:WXG100 family type VII secretion target [Actinomadura logoneensis]RFU43308.1 WXG100 family type VII secretion target [Actinomadura logoneensis]